METTVYIQNLKCSGCANTITREISSIKGIQNVTISVEENSVTFDYTTDEKLQEVKEKLKSLGYPEDGEANSLTAKAKSYVSCAIGKMS
jgi:copper chaperone CopZ